MWLFLYKILTQTIIIFGRIRYAICKKKLTLVIRKDRTFRSPDVRHGYVLVCCDCGLEHKVWVLFDTEYMQPIRPKNYDYKMRKWSEKPDKFEEM